ncbi:MAG: DUF58 domain-containing protein [Chitinophagaceae bacterium]|nr:MAG: DUF58 domain-containing protein [Chitinophagaceae bacterium]
MDTSELLKKVRKIEIKTRGLSNQVFAGEYHSAFKGKGMSFSEIREYQYGDDIRNIDWNVTARLDQVFVKVYEEERELNVFFLIDLSASNLFGTTTLTKKEIITELFATLSFSASQNNDKVGAAFFSKDIDLFVPPKKGRKHILRLIREMLYLQAKSEETAIKNALQHTANWMKKRSIIFIISDFFDKGYEDPLRIASLKHDVVGIKVNDSFEYDLPNAGLLPMRDLESGKYFWFDTASEKARKKVKAAFLEHQDKTRSLFRKSGAGLIEINTGQSYITALHAFFKNRDRTR